MECFICKSKENIVTGFPRNKPELEKWKSILNISDKTTLQTKKLCIQHFDKKYHATLLDPNSVRSRYIFPIPYNENKSHEAVGPTSPETNKRSFDCVDLPCTSSEKKKPVNYELILQIKNDEINELKAKVKELTSQNSKLKTQLESAISLKSSVSRALESANNLCPVSKTLINLLVTGKKGHIYSADEKSFCQNFYYKYPGAFKYLRNILGSGLPSPRTLIHWQSMKQFNIGIIKEVMCHLKTIGESLTDEEKEVTLILDEMDGKRGLRYCKTRDMLVGYEHLLERSNKLAKKFLVFMIRGLNQKLGNFVFATFATEKGINGTFIIFLFIDFLSKEKNYV